MLYLDDRKSVVNSMEEIDGYDGKVSSCIDIVSELCDKHSATKTAEILHKKYAIDMSHVHKCISIYLGELGTMDDEYIKKYPESNLSNLGTTLMEYNSAVKDTIALAKLVCSIKLPHYNLDSFSVVYQCNLDLDKTFDSAEDWVDIALQYSMSRSIFASYNGDFERIRRRISTSVGKNIPKRYVEFVPKPMDREGVIMAQWNRKDFKIYRDKFIFNCNGNELSNVNTYANEAISAFGIDGHVSFMYQSNTKASLTMEIDNWNTVVMEDLIINDSALARILSVANGMLDEHIDEEMLHRNRSIVVHVAHPRVRCVFRYNKGILKISIASLSIDDTAIVISVAIVWKLLKKYRKSFAEIYEKYSLNVQENPIHDVKTKSGSKIDALRKRLPELFANNYTRECHNLPIMLDTEEEAKEYWRMGRLVIKYPQSGKYSKWYTSPSDDLYVGLKINRLSNKDKFKHIITCYSSNHYENPARETYVYYRGSAGTRKGPEANLITLRILSRGRRGPLPIAMTTEYDLREYTRFGTGGPFIDCIAHALDVDKDKFRKLVRKGMKDGLLNVVRQEMWDRSDKEILSGINDILDGTKYYRLFEEVYDCNILIVEIGHRSKYNISIPQCKGKYIWEPRKGKYIVVMKNEKKLYEDHLVSYELVTKGDKMLFDEEDPLVSSIISFKLANTMRSDIDEDDVRAQYITEFGKCNVVSTKNGMIKCNSRPLYKPTVDDKVVRENSVLYNYLGKIPLSSTAKHLYFPNNTSFMDWWIS
jgi:hypothetical protein